MLLTPTQISAYNFVHSTRSKLPLAIPFCDPQKLDRNVTETSTARYRCSPMLGTMPPSFDWRHETSQKEKSVYDVAEVSCFSSLRCGNGEKISPYWFASLSRSSQGECKNTSKRSRPPR